MANHWFDQQEWDENFVDEVETRLEVALTAVVRDNPAEFQLTREDFDSAEDFDEEVENLVWDFSQQHEVFSILLEFLGEDAVAELTGMPTNR